MVKNNNSLMKSVRRVPIGIQSTVLMTILVTIVITFMAWTNYNHSIKTLLNKEIDGNATILSLETSNLDSYVKELIAFSIQSCYDSRFSRDVASSDPLDDGELDYMKDEMRAYYYSRSDLNTYHLYLLNQQQIIGRHRQEQHFTATDNYVLSPVDELAMNECGDSKYFLSIQPALSSDGFFTFYHSLIQIQDKASMAVVKAEVDRSFVNKLTKSHNQNGEFIVIYNDNNELLFSGNMDLINPDKNPVKLNEIQLNHTDINLGGEKYLATIAQSSQYGIKMISLKPYSAIYKDFPQLLIMCIAEGGIIWIISIIAIYILMKHISGPLTVLAKELENVGHGNFDTQIDIDGAAEIIELKDSFNSMTNHIQALIKENYIVKLNEQSSRLIALEAQINPHFLYNTLQAISTEALINDQLQIHDMVTYLATLLRYSIKGGDFVTLADEIEHVKKYFFLQKIRMDDNLSYEIEIPQDAMLSKIPKISIQTLAENAIIHGVQGNVSSINVSIHAQIQGGQLIINVSDNGCGMSHKQLLELKQSFDFYDLPGGTKGIGLANLYSRLHILYEGVASMDIDSTEGVGTNIIITIPYRKM